MLRKTAASAILKNGEILIIRGRHMNIINAIINLVNNPVTIVASTYIGRNRANNMGDALEEYVKDLFSGAFGLEESERLRKHSETFSYLGNPSNPPDAMLKGGDAIEVKKIESEGSALALNSSYPKHTLLASSPMISAACRTAETWTEKDMIYIVGCVKQQSIKRLAMVYGLDYCASDECYSKIKKKIKEGVETIPGIEFAETKELGHVNKVDPLGITYLRVRGMWGIENPWKVFEYVYKKPANKSFDFMCLISKSKYETFSNRKELEDLANKTDNLDIADVMIKDPDNPARLREVKLITFSKE